jgi:hypothetical protein
MKSRDSNRNVDSDLPANRDRLQRHCPVRATNQDVGPNARSERCLSARADIVASQEPRSRHGSRGHRPDHDTPAGDAEIKP